MSSAACISRTRVVTFAVGLKRSRPCYCDYQKRSLTCGGGGCKCFGSVWMNFWNSRIRTSCVPRATVQDRNRLMQKSGQKSASKRGGMVLDLSERRIGKGALAPCLPTALACGTAAGGLRSRSGSPYKTLTSIPLQPLRLDHILIRADRRHSASSEFGSSVNHSAGYAEHCGSAWVDAKWHLRKSATAGEVATIEEASVSSPKPDEMPKPGPSDQPRPRPGEMPRPRPDVQPPRPGEMPQR